MAVVKNCTSRILKCTTPGSFRHNRKRRFVASSGKSSKTLLCAEEKEEGGGRWFLLSRRGHQKSSPPRPLIKKGAPRPQGINETISLTPVGRFASRDDE